MKTAHNPGNYHSQVPARTIDSADVPTGYASRLWKTLIPGDIQHSIDGIFKQFTGSGWENLPQELVDEIVGYLLDDPDALRACSLTCKCLFGATRPLIHERLVCLGSRPERPKVAGSLFSRHDRNPETPGTFERLIDADRLGVLRYTRHLTFKPKNGSINPHFNPRDMQEYLPHLRTITKLHTLTLNTFHLHSFIPIFDEHFGMFTHTLRHLDIRGAGCVVRELLYIICQFPLLEDLTIVSPPNEYTANPGDPIPRVTQSPPLRGKLVLVQADSRDLSHGLAAFPGGLNFRSLELSGCKHLGAALTACGHTATSISYLWRGGGIDSESNLSIQHIAI